MNISWLEPKYIFAVIVLVMLISIPIGVYLERRKKKSLALRKRFGAEYDHAVIVHGSEQKAEAKLLDRAARVESLKIHDLAPTERARFLAEWQIVQSRFIDHPKGAVIEADELINAVLLARGYPASTFEQQAADVSVNHPLLMENYRSAHGIAVRPGPVLATTEELRAAMIHYRSIFDELVQAQTPIEHNTAA
jgi:hypothetical protein